MSDREFELLTSLMIKSNGAVGLPIYDFLLVSNSKLVTIGIFLTV